jgi:large subunit ribosomal protein L11
MAQKEIQTTLKLQIEAGKANPAPPIGPALGQHGINIQDFCSQFNDKTKDKMGNIIPVIITIHKDRSFSFVLKTPPASDLIKKMANVQKGSAEPHKTKVGKITMQQCENIAEQKLEDLNAYTKEQGAKIIAGTARSMGIQVIK